MRLHATRRAAIAQARGLGNPLWDLAGVPASLDLRFAESKSLVDAVSGQNLITFTRASNGAVVNSAGQIEIVAANVPRFDHDPVTLESLGLLVEEQRTNLLFRSEEFDNAVWAIARCSVTANSTSSPSGATTADTVVEDSSNNTHRVIQSSITVLSGAVVTYSLYFRFDGRSQISLYVDSGDGATAFAAYFSASGFLASEVAGTGTFTSSTFASLANGWYRASITGVVGTATSIRASVFLASGGSRIYQGDSRNALTIWGAQLEVGAFPTSYIPTTGTAATRTADVVSITGANFSSWYRQNEGTVFAESSSFSNLSGSRVVSAIDDGSMSNRFQITFASGYTPNFAAVSTGTVSADLYASAPAQGFNTRFCTTYGVNDFVLSSNGGNSVTDTSGALPISVSTARLGVFQNNTGYLNGTIRRLTYWPQRLPNSTLQNITL
jgi:hypothetical protein